MKRFFVIAMLLVVSTSAAGAAQKPRPRPRSSAEPTVVAVALTTLRYVFRLVSNGDGVTIPIPRPGDQNTKTCCK